MACAQCSQQKKVPSFSRPCPTMRIPQFSQVGASAWIAHSKLSNEDCAPTHGYAATRETAMTAFAKSWRRE
jgi:hypothetical protein